MRRSHHKRMLSKRITAVHIVFLYYILLILLLSPPPPTPTLANAKCIHVFSLSLFLLVAHMSRFVLPSIVPIVYPFSPFSRVTFDHIKVMVMLML